MTVPSRYASPAPSVDSAPAAPAARSRGPGRAAGANRPGAMRCHCGEPLTTCAGCGEPRCAACDPYRSDDCAFGV